MHHRKVWTAAVLCGATALATSACSSGGSSSDNKDASSGADSRGPITYVTGKDNSGVWQPTVDRWNAAHPNEKVTLKQQSDNADQQHDDVVQHMQAKDSSYDVVTVDVVWTPEFAAKGWLVPLEGKFALDTNGMLPAPLKAATYNNKVYAAPFASDGGLLFYRSDLVKTPPKTWDEMWKMCDIAKAHHMGCYTGQFKKYEGLTVNAAEAMNSYGAKIVDDQGKPTVDSPQATAGLQMLADHVKSGDIPKASLTYQEEEGRQAFEAGNTLFHRNWPYIYNLAMTDGSSQVKGKFGVAPLPGKDGVGTSSLGGHSLAISSYCKNKATALDFLKFVEQDPQQKFFMEKGSLAPVKENIYSDPELVKKYPYLPTLLTSIKNAVPRPVTPFYPAVTTAVEDNAYAALSGAKPASQAVKDMQAAIQDASK